MNQVVNLPLLGLSLSVPRSQAESAIEAQIDAGEKIAASSIDTTQTLEVAKKEHWQWVLDTCQTLKTCFGHESVGLYFSSQSYIVSSMKLDDFEREKEEFVPTVKARLNRLEGLKVTLPVIPEPPAGQLLAALVHPLLAVTCWRDFELGEYVRCIEAAVKSITELVKDRTAGSIASEGVDLVLQAYNPEVGQLTDPLARLEDREGFGSMLAGFVLRYGHLPSYTNFSVEEAARVLAVASYLLYQIEASPQRQAGEDSHPNHDPDESAGENGGQS